MSGFGSMPLDGRSAGGHDRSMNFQLQPLKPCDPCLPEGDGRDRESSTPAVQSISPGIARDGSTPRSQPAGKWRASPPKRWAGMEGQGKGKGALVWDGVGRRAEAGEALPEGASEQRTERRPEAPFRSAITADSACRLEEAYAIPRPAKSAKACRPLSMRLSRRQTKRTGTRPYLSGAA